MKKRNLTLLSAALTVQAASAAVIVTPTSVAVTGDTGSFGSGAFGVQGNPSTWLDGTGLSTSSTVANGATVPAILPTHAYGWNNAAYASRLRNVPAAANGSAEFTFTLGAATDLQGIILWNHGEGGAAGSESMRGIETVAVSYSTDNGVSFTPGDTLTFLMGPQGGPSGGTNGQQIVLGELQNFSSVLTGVTDVRLNASNFDQGNILGFGELRFTAIPEPSTTLLAGLASGLLFARRRRLS